VTRVTRGSFGLKNVPGFAEIRLRKKDGIWRRIVYSRHVPRSPGQAVIKAKCIRHTDEKVNAIRTGLNMPRSRDNVLVRLCQYSTVRDDTRSLRNIEYRPIDIAHRTRLQPSAFAEFKTLERNCRKALRS